MRSHNGRLNGGIWQRTFRRRRARGPAGPGIPWVDPQRSFTSGGSQFKLAQARLFQGRTAVKEPLQIGAFEAKNRLGELLRLVEHGEEVTITRHGKPVARLVPAESAGRERVLKALEELKQMRKKRRLGGLSLKELISAGRRY